jgi:hypothetical protein
MLKLSEIGISKLLPKLTKDKGKEKEVAIYWKIVPPKAQVNLEGWKVPLLRGMYVA